MGQESFSHSASQEIPSLLWNPNFHFRVDKPPPLVPILNQSNKVHNFPFSLRSILILFFHLCLGLQRGLFPSGFATNILYVLLISPMLATYPPISSSLINHINNTWWSVQVKKHLNMESSPASCHFLPLSPIFSSAPCFQISSIYVLPLM